MKAKILPLITSLTLITLFTISSCSDDDGGPTLSIVGTWVLIQNIESNCDDPADNFNETLTCNANDCITLIFRSDNTFQTIEIEDGDTFTISGSYSINGNNLTFSGVDFGVPVNLTLSFTLEQDRLITVDENDPDLGCTFTSVFERQ